MSASDGESRISLTLAKTWLSDSIKAGGGWRHIVTRMVHALRRTFAEGVNPVMWTTVDAAGGTRARERRVMAGNKVKFSSKRTDGR